MLWHCASCTAAYSVGAPACPQCSSTEREDDTMPKIHRHRPPTDEALAEGGPVQPGELIEPAETETIEDVQRAFDEGEKGVTEPPKPGPRRRTTRVNAGHASGSGSAGAPA